MSSRRMSWFATFLGWLVALLMFGPILWMASISIKTEQQAIATPPLLFFRPTFDAYVQMIRQGHYAHFALNSVVISLSATLLAIALSVPAAYAMAFYPTRRTSFLMVWMISTKMMPAVSVLMPIYQIYGHFGMLDSRIGLILVYALMNLPITVWLIYTYFLEIPVEVLEAGRVEGLTTWQEIRHLVLKMSLPGLFSTGLLSLVLCWNEAFWSINLTSAHAAPLTAFIASFSSPEGLFWARLSAASILAIAPITIVGFMSQRQLVRGLTFGAVK